MAPAKKPTTARGATKKIGGVEVPGDPLLDCERHPPTKLFPDYKTTPPKPLTTEEKIQVARFLSLRSNVHEGPFYTVLGDTSRVGKPTTSLAASFDPFEGMPTYSQKYLKRRRRIPKLDSRPYVLRFFPNELWTTLDPTSTIQVGDGTSSSSSKKLQLLKEKRANGLGNLDQENLSGGEEAEGGEQGGDEEVLPEDREEEEEEEVDDAFEEDEDDGDDYNAEQYFDDGGEDAGNDYDGGEAEGGDFF